MKTVYVVLILILLPNGYLFSNKNLISNDQNNRVLITNIERNERDNEISLNLEMLPLSFLKDSLSLQPSSYTIDLKSKYALHKNLIIKEITKSNKDIIILFKLPLKEAKFYGQEIQFIISALTTDTVLTAKKEVVLGSILNPVDLRAYSAYYSKYSLITPILIISLVMVVLAIMLNTYKKYIFKKKYIKKHKPNKKEILLDPFTFVPIEKNDTVISNGKKILLLDSWKRIDKFDPKSRAKYDDFFETFEIYNFLKPKTTLCKLYLKAWFGVFGIFIGWLVFYFLQTSEGIHIFNWTKSVVGNEISRKFSIVQIDLLLGICISFFYCLFLAGADYYNGNKQILSLKYSLKVLIQICIVLSGFLLQILLITYVYSDVFFSSLFTGISISLFFNLALNSKRPTLFLVMVSIFNGIICSFIFHIGQINYFSNHFGYYPFTFGALIFLGVFSVLFPEKYEQKIIDVKKIVLTKFALPNKQIS